MIINCPHCNGECKVQYRTSKGKKYYWVVCKICFCRTPDTFTNEQDAIDCWDRRA